MHAAQCSNYGRNVDDTLLVRRRGRSSPNPTLEPAVKESRGHALVRVQVTALAPGDRHLTRGIQGPPSIPYIPGGADLCGVEETAAGGGGGRTHLYLKASDRVLRQFEKNWGGLAEYVLVRSGNCARDPPACFTSVEAAVIGSRGAATLLISRQLEQGDWVLAIGGSSGMDLQLLVQLTRTKGPLFVDAASTQTDLMKELGVDRVIDCR
ncbi:unnamed protein product [Laminaria digitata]